MVLFAVFCLSLNGRERERRIDRAGRMSLVRATPTRTGYVAYISERAFTQGTFFVASIW